MAWFYFVIILSTFIRGLEAISDIKPGILYNHAELFIKTNAPVFHIEFDQYKSDGSLLIGTNNHLQTVNIRRIEDVASLLVTGFAQVNTTHAFIVDNQKHCIRVINRENNQLRDFAGTCGTSGYVEGRPGEGRFHKPWGIIADVRDPDRLLVADKSNHAIRSVNLISGEVGTVRNNGFYFPKSMQWEGAILMVTSYNYISMIAWWTNGEVTNTHMAGTSRKGDTFGRFNVAQFGTLTDAERVRENQYIVADFENRKLKILDMINGVVSPVCFRGRTIECTFPHQPISMLNLGNTLYVGTQKCIHRLTEFREARRLLFIGKYDVECHDLNSGSSRKLGMGNTLGRRRAELQTVCGFDCMMSLTLQPSYKCIDDQLTVYWPTDKIFPPEAKELPKPLADKLQWGIYQSETLKNVGITFELSEIFVL